MGDRITVYGRKSKFQLVFKIKDRFKCADSRESSMEHRMSKVSKMGLKRVYSGDYKEI